MGIEIRVYKISVNHRNGSLLRCLFDNRSGMMNIHGSAVTTRTLLTCRLIAVLLLTSSLTARRFARRGDDKVNAMRRIMTVVKLIQLVTHVLLTLAAINNLCHLILVGASAIQKPTHTRGRVA